MQFSDAALPAYPRLTEHLLADVAVIGGGMAGILTASALRDAGLRVVLLEEDRLAGGVTARTTARVSAQHGLFCERLVRDFGEHLARQYVMAQLHAVKQYRDLAASRGIGCGLTEQTSRVCTAPNGPDLSREHAAALLLGAPAELQAVHGLPFPVREALCFTGQASLEPAPLLAALLPGLDIYERSPVRDIRGRTVRCDGGSVEAAEIVVATRYPMLERWGFYHLKLRQEQAYLLALENAPRIDGWYLDADTRGWSLQQRGDTLILSGGLHRCGGNQGDSYERLRAQAKLWFPEAREVAAWSSQDCVTLDGVPYIGRYSAATPHLHVAAGFGRWGMTNSMVAATLLTAEILGKHYPYADVFSPARFFPSASIEAMMEGALYAARGKSRRLYTAAERETANIALGNAAIVKHHGKQYGVYRDERGGLHAVSPVCPHRGCALEWNADEKTWDCPCHGSRFDYTGKRLYHPAKAALKQFDATEL
ncbi:MAG: FAD-dependent oxidoreductase [Oscillospiraceae bacterium]|nr:FAD-dependent oxidoreductase [Oscillospiraceae bacterium]